MASKQAGKAAAAAQQHYEFFGPHGTALLLVAMPLVVLSLPFACNVSGCMTLLPKFWVPGFPPGTRLYTHEGLAAVAGWFALVLLLHALLPGERAAGVALPDGSRLTYKLNGARRRGGCAAAAAGRARPPCRLHRHRRRHRPLPAAPAGARRPRPPLPGPFPQNPAQPSPSLPSPTAPRCCSAPSASARSTSRGRPTTSCPC
jgi:hypothetical protein